MRMLSLSHSGKGLPLAFTNPDNMNRFLLSVSFMLVLMVMASSCVMKKKYTELDTAYKNCDQENTELKKQNIDLTAQNNELSSKLYQLQLLNTRLISDSTQAGIAWRDLKSKYDRISQAYDELNALMQLNAKTSTAEMQRLLTELQKAQSDLQTKEEKLRQSENDLAQKTADLEAKQKRLNELQSILDKKDSVVQALKNKVLEALTGFVDKGLSVEMKNGKVYVSMDEKLLFATGSSEVASNGVEALKNLARVLESNPDINITVEGHTDNVPYKSGSGPINDNWDLSVMRATAVVKILLKNSRIDPKRITASGRSQFLPVDPANTAEARAKNRRTDIILTPKLDEILKILEGN